MIPVKCYFDGVDEYNGPDGISPCDQMTKLIARELLSTHQKTAKSYWCMETVDKEDTGILIGKKGGTVNRIRSDHKVICTLNTKEPGLLPLFCISGTITNVQNALKEWEECLDHAKENKETSSYERSKSTPRLTGPANKRKRSPSPQTWNFSSDSDTEEDKENTSRNLGRKIKF